MGALIRKDSTMTKTEHAILSLFWVVMLCGFMLAAVM